MYNVPTFAHDGQYLAAVETLWPEHPDDLHLTHLQRCQHSSLVDGRDDYLLRLHSFSLRLSPC
jgi:hypothetical protein